MPHYTPVYSDHEVDNAPDPKERERMLVVNRMSINPMFRDDEQLHTYTLETLRGMQQEVRNNSHRAKLRRAAQQTIAPVAKPRPAAMPSKWHPTLRSPRYKAQLWHAGRNYHLGYFDTQAQRDAAVRAARFRVSLGLHPRDWTEVIK